MAAGGVRIITDQPPDTGVGIYADSVYRLLRETVPDIRVIFTGVSPPPAQAGWEPVPGARQTDHAWSVVSTLRYNYGLLRKILSPTQVAHFCGIWYGAVGEYPQSIAFIHDYYPRRIRLSTLSNPSIFLRDTSSLWQYLILPRHVREARVRVVPTYHVQRQLERGAALSSVVMHHWSEPYRYHPRERAAARKALGLPEDGQLLLNISASTSNKGHALLSRIAARLGPAERLVKLGGGLTGTERVIEMPPLPYDAYPLLFNACDVYVHTSTEEGFGRPLLEALSSGLPIVASRNEVSEEVLGEGAVLLPPGASAEQWLSSIRQLAQESERTALQERASRQLAQFDPDSARRSLLQLYQQVTED